MDSRTRYRVVFVIDVKLAPPVNKISQETLPAHASLEAAKGSAVYGWDHQVQKAEEMFMSDYLGIRAQIWRETSSSRWTTVSGESEPIWIRDDDGIELLSPQGEWTVINIQD